MAWEEGEIGGEPTVVVRHGGARLELALTGATVLRWGTSSPEDGVVELAAGYTSATELQEGRSAAFAVMAPFVNRVRGGRYIVAGTEHDLRPAMHPQDAEVIHGLVRRARWQLDGVDEDGELARVRLSTTIGAQDHPGYPFALELEAAYEVGGQVLRAELRARNVGPTVAPVALGWHPYLSLPGHETVDGLTLEVPARSRVRTDEDRVPVPGEGAYEQVAGGARWAPLEDARLDTSFLLAGEDMASTWLRSPLTGRAVEVRQRVAQAPVMHVFTADTLPGRERRCIALEPLGAVADAFNRAEWEEQVRLVPGDTRELLVEIVHHPDS